MEQGELLLYLGVHLALTALPGVAAVLVAARRGVGQVPLLLGIGLAASGIVAMLAFWCYYAEPEIGKTFSFFVVFGSALGAGALPPRRRHRPLAAASALDPPGPLGARLGLSRLPRLPPWWQRPPDRDVGQPLHRPDAQRQRPPALLRQLLLRERAPWDAGRGMAPHRPAAAADRLRALATTDGVGQRGAALPGARGDPAAALDRRPLGAAAGGAGGG